MKPVLFILAIIAALLALGALESSRWQECRQVGHGWFYCLSEATQ